jgi:hypothetical protein
MELRTESWHHRTHGVLRFLCDRASWAPFNIYSIARSPASLCRATGLHWVRRVCTGCATLALLSMAHARPFVVSMLLVRQLRSSALIGMLICVTICFTSFRCARDPTPMLRVVAHRARAGRADLTTIGCTPATQYPKWNGFCRAVRAIAQLNAHRRSYTTANLYAAAAARAREWEEHALLARSGLSRRDLSLFLERGL